MSCPRGGDRGSASVVTAAVVAAVLLLVGTLLTAGSGRSAAVRAQGAADAGALAAASALAGLVPGAPCPLARTVVGASGAAMSSCDTSGAFVRVVVAVDSGPFHLRALAVAGPDPLHRLVPDGLVRWASPALCVWCACRPAGHRCPGRPGRVRVPGPTAPSIKESRARHEEARDRREPREGEDDRAIPR